MEVQRSDRDSQGPASARRDAAPFVPVPLNGGKALRAALRPGDIFDELPPVSSELSVRIETRRYGKKVTVIDGFDAHETDIEALAKDLKNHVAAGGTHKEGRIELQGDHSGRVSEFLRKRGFTVK